MSKRAVVFAIWGSLAAPGSGATQVPESPGPLQAVHLLNRAAYGPRPGDVDQVMRVGLSAYLDRQLEPDSIDDNAVATALRAYSIMGFSRAELVALNTERRRLTALARTEDSTATMNQRGSRPELAALRAQDRILQLEFQQVALVRAISSERQLLEVMVDFWTNHFNVYIAKGPLRTLAPEFIEQGIRPHALGSFRELLGATAHSPAMLAYLDNGRSVAPGSEPPRPTAAHSGIEMAEGRGQDVTEARARVERAIAGMPGGLNENYARELLELHTLGVDGGYTQEDVIAVARIFTGWSYDGNGDFSFRFNEWAHDEGEKTVMGRVFPGDGGMEEGEQLLDLLASHPATMRFVGTKLCTRFVSDVAPAGCVDAVVEAWIATDGNIAAMVRAILTSPEFWDETNFDGKIKTPLEFMASAVRALGGRPDTTTMAARAVARLGQPLYLHEAPTGYPEEGEAWVNSGALLNRMNFALGLAAGRAPGLEIPLSQFPDAADTGLMIQSINDTVLHGRATENTLRVMRERSAAIVDPRTAWTLLVGLAIGGPEFQRQ